MEENAKAVFGKRVHVNCRYNPLPKWFNEACIIAKRNFNIARTQFSKQNTEDNRRNYIKAKIKYNNTRKRAKQIYMKRESMNLENISKRDPRNFWKEIKRVRATSAKITNAEISIDQFYEHFKTLLSNHDHNQNISQDDNCPNISDFDLDKPFTTEELKTAVFNQNKGKATGPDNILAEIIKTSYSFIESILLDIFQFIL